MTVAMRRYAAHRALAYLEVIDTTAKPRRPDDMKRLIEAIEEVRAIILRIAGSNTAHQSIAGNNRQTKI